MTRAAIYQRGCDPEAMKSQRSEIVRYCAERDLEVIGEYHDMDETGERSALMVLLKDAGMETFDVVVTHCPFQFSREVVTSMNVMTTLLIADVSIETVTMGPLSSCCLFTLLLDECTEKEAEQRRRKMKRRASQRKRLPCSR